MLSAVSFNDVWQKIVDFFTGTVKDFFVELLKENPPIKFILLVAGAALVLIGLIVIIAVCAKKNKAKKAAKKAARKAVKENAKSAKKADKKKEAVVTDEAKVAPAAPVQPAPVAPVAPAQPVPAPVPYVEDEKRFDAFDDELPLYNEEKATSEQVDMSKFIAEDVDDEPVFAPASKEAEPVFAPAKEEPAPVEEKHYIEPENNDNFVDDSWGKAKINVKPKKVQKTEKVEEVAAEEEPAPAKKTAKKKETTVEAEPAPAKKAPAKKKAAKVEKVEEVAPAEEVEETEKPKVVGKYTIEDMGYAYQFHLYANNGQLLYESREYASVNSCKSGIATFKKNVAECDYRIDVDKNGGYKFIFKKGNSIYIGETYSTAKAAERSAESVKRFAQVSEIVE